MTLDVIVLMSLIIFILVVLLSVQLDKHSKLKYHVVAVIGCYSSIKTFDKKEDMDNFLKYFVEKYGSLNDGGDNFIDRVYYGVNFEITYDVKIKEG